MKKLTALLLILALALSMTACSSLLYDSQSLDDSSFTYFVASSVGDHGDVTFYTTIDAENGYIRLVGHRIGVLYLDGEEQPFTWDDDYIYFGEEENPYIYSEYYDSELERMEGLLTLYFMEDEISIAFRPKANHFRK